MSSGFAAASLLPLLAALGIPDGAVPVEIRAALLLFGSALLALSFVQSAD